jgi:hypothetical protein
LQTGCPPFADHPAGVEQVIAENKAQWLHLRTPTARVMSLE